MLAHQGHNSAFAAEYAGLQTPSILLNGKGNVTRYLGARPNSVIPPPFTMTFQRKEQTGLGRAKKYLLRLINTSFDSTFVFSIDNHKIQVITSDFVPIVPYPTESVLVGIGQRYNVIVEASPTGGIANPVPADGNFWIRTQLAQGCPIPGNQRPILNYERAGILRYDTGSTSNPTSKAWPNIPTGCSDEPYGLLNPVFPWTVGGAANGDEQFNVSLGPGSLFFPVPGFPLALFSFQPERNFRFTALQVDYDDPTISHIGDPSHTWDPKQVVIPENYRDDDWVRYVELMHINS